MNNIALILLAFATLSAGLAASPACGDQPPNIIFILADDLGYGDLGCYGQDKILTPNLDRLAAQGMRFTQHYSGAPVCAPARCTLLTGQNGSHAQIRGNRDSGNGRPFPGQWPITPDVITIAAVLNKAGYRAGGFGKWGLGPTDSSGSPMKHGFDRFYGYNCQRNAHSYYPPFLDDDDGVELLNAQPIPGHNKQPEGEVLAEAYRGQVYAPERILEEAVEWLDANHQQPFFLYLPFVEPHVAMQPPQVWLDRYPQAWDEELGEYRGENGYLPHPRPRAAYAAMISDLDEHVGTILDRLETLGVADNTLVVFTSDNGPTHAGRDDNRWHVGGAACNFFNSNGGLKGYKGSCDEGGIRVPCLVRWPGHVPAGSTSDLPSYFPDWYPTLVAVTGAELPADVQALDGIDLSGALLGSETPQRRTPMVWEFPEYGGFVALRQDNWKAIRRGIKTKRPGSWELYDLGADPTETNDLAGTHADIVQEMAEHHRQTRVAESDFPLPIFDR